MNNALCNECHTLVPSEIKQRGKDVYLVKECPKCGSTEALISNDSERYFSKSRLDLGPDQRECRLNCTQCGHRVQPTLVFIDVTNRCNMNCPICVNNTPKMGFLFEPPLEYFEKIFKYLASQDPPPAVQLFGGEPTVREDLPRIIRMGRREYGLNMRLVTNGVKLADKDYCREILAKKPTILIAYDGDNPQVYKDLRGAESYLDIKRRALENIQEIGKVKTAIMSLVAWDYNADSMRGLFDYCWQLRDTVRAIYFMPLMHTWKEEDWSYRPQRFTMEDLENKVDEVFPEDRVDFIPIGLIGSLKAFMRCLDIPPLPFLGAHPNCESVYFLVSLGGQYVPIQRFLKTSFHAAVQDILDAEVVLARRLESFEKGLAGRLCKKLRLFALAIRCMGFWSAAGTIRRNFKIGAALKGRGAGKALHLAMALCKLAVGVKSRRIQLRHFRIEEVLQLIILPFEDRDSIQTERLERCPSAFAYVDPETGQVKTVPTCAWPLFSADMLQRIAEKYPAGAAQKAADHATL